ncbi:MAG: RNA methyltransferase [Methylococcales bacterium]
MLSSIRFVLVGTTHPGNIGAVARAMKNMGLSNLYLVKPKHYPNADATARASGADDLLSNAMVCNTVQEAIADCHLVIGASVRSRTISWPEITAQECPGKVRSIAPHSNTAILFGREHSGLTNAELDCCHFLMKIPCNPRFSSLNLASAAQIIGYELFTQLENSPEPAVETEILAKAAQLEMFYHHLFQTMQDLGFIHPDRSRTIMRRLRRLFNRARIESKEIDMLRGILSAIQRISPTSKDSN